MTRDVGGEEKVRTVAHRACGKGDNRPHLVRAGGREKWERGQGDNTGDGGGEGESRTRDCC